MLVSLPPALVDRLKGGRLGALVNFTARYEVNGRSILVPVLSGVGFDNLAAHEPWMNGVIATLLQRKPGAFIDVGANLGQTLLKVKTLAPEVRYIGFEPNPVCCHYLEKLIAINRFRSCTVLPVGLSNAAGIVSLYTRTDSDASGTIVRGFRVAKYGYCQTRYVPVFAGDAMLKAIGRPPISVLKIDVEGAELEVMQGFAATLETRPYVVGEILPLAGPPDPRYVFRKPRQDRLLGMMREADYRLFRLLPNGSARALEDIEIHDDLSLTNYLFVPADEAGWVEQAFGAAPARRCG